MNVDGGLPNLREKNGRAKAQPRKNECNLLFSRGVDVVSNLNSPFFPIDNARRKAWLEAAKVGEEAHVVDSSLHSPHSVHDFRQKVKRKNVLFIDVIGVLINVIKNIINESIHDIGVWLQIPPTNQTGCCLFVSVHKVWKRAEKLILANVDRVDVLELLSV